MGVWLQILQTVRNSTLFYILFDCHDSLGFVFIWKSKFTLKFEIGGNFLIKSPCVRFVNIGLKFLQQLFSHLQSDWFTILELCFDCLTDVNFLVEGICNFIN